MSIKLKTLHIVTEETARVFIQPKKGEIWGSQFFECKKKHESGRGGSVKSQTQQNPSMVEIIMCGGRGAPGGHP